MMDAEAVPPVVDCAVIEARKQVVGVPDVDEPIVPPFGRKERPGGFQIALLDRKREDGVQGFVSEGVAQEVAQMSCPLDRRHY